MSSGRTAARPPSPTCSWGGVRGQVPGQRPPALPPLTCRLATPGQQVQDIRVAQSRAQGGEVAAVARLQPWLMSTLCTEGPRARPPSSARPPVAHPCVKGAGLAHSGWQGGPRPGTPCSMSPPCAGLWCLLHSGQAHIHTGPGPLQLQLGLPGCLPMATEAGDLVCVCKSGLGTSSSHYRVSLKAWATALNRANVVTAGSWQHREGTDSKPASHVQCQVRGPGRRVSGAWAAA